MGVRHAPESVSDLVRNTHTLKQRTFIAECVRTGNATEAALVAYDTTDRDTARGIASENLAKPAIHDAVAEFGRGLAWRRDGRDVTATPCAHDTQRTPSCGDGPFRVLHAGATLLGGSEGIAATHGPGNRCDGTQKVSAFTVARLSVPRRLEAPRAGRANAACPLASFTW